jgi:hypothetical protein
VRQTGVGQRDGGGGRAAEHFSETSRLSGGGCQVHHRHPFTVDTDSGQYLITGTGNAGGRRRHRSGSPRARNARTGR